MIGIIHVILLKTLQYFLRKIYKQDDFVILDAVICRHAIPQYKIVSIDLIILMVLLTITFNIIYLKHF